MSSVQQEDTDRSATGKAWYLAILLLGVCIGLLVFLLADLKLQWLIYSAIALVGVVFVLAFPHKHRLLSVIFILSLQVEVYLRLLYGHAQGEGLAIPLVVLTAAALFGWYAVTGHLKSFTLGGSMRRPIIALVMTTMLSMLFTSEQFIGFTYFVFLLEYYFLYWLSYNMVQSEEDFRRIVKLLLVVLAMQSIVYYIQSGLGVTFDLVGQTWEEGGIARPGGTVSTNPAGFASFIMPLLFMVIAMVMVKDPVWPRGYAVILSLMGITALVLTFTRGAWSGFVLGMIVLSIMGLKSRVISGKIVLTGTVAAVIGGMLLLPVMLERVAGDYSGESVSTTSGMDERMGLIQIALNIISEHPLTGIGPGSYGYLFKNYIPGGMDQWLFVVHNEFLLRAAEIGIPGALAFAFFLIVGFKVALRLSRSGHSLISVCALGWFAALIALVWQMNWVPWTGWSYNAMLWIMLGLMDSAQRLVEPGGNREGLSQ